MKSMLKLFSIWWWIILIVMPLSISCGGGDSEKTADDDAAFGDDDFAADDDQDGALEDYLNAIPDPESLMLMLPGSNLTQTQTLGELAEYYAETVDFTTDVNYYILEMLSVIDQITIYNPTSFDGATITWGPWQESGLAAVTERFIITNVEGNHYEYHLDWRDKDSEDEADWVVIWQGSVDADTETERRGVGLFTIDYAAAKELDPPRVDALGTIEVDYDTLTDGRRIDIEFVEFLPDDEETPINGFYNYHEHADLTGKFTFDAWVDLEGADGPDGLFEHLWFNTRWEGGGNGRTDIIATDGGIPFMPLGGALTAEQINISECWDDQFLRVYYFEEIICDDGTQIPGLVEGDPNDCTLEEQQPVIQ